MTLTRRGERVFDAICWGGAMILIVAVLMMLVVATDHYRCARLHADPAASDYTVNYYCGGK